MAEREDKRQAGEDDCPSKPKKFVCVCVLCVFGSPLTAVMDGPPSPPHILKEGGGWLPPPPSWKFLEPMNTFRMSGKRVG